MRIGQEIAAEAGEETSGGTALERAGRELALSLGGLHDEDSP